MSLSSLANRRARRDKDPRILAIRLELRALALREKADAAALAGNKAASQSLKAEAKRTLKLLNH